MSRRADYTLILMTNRFTVRADFFGQKLVQVGQPVIQESPPEAGWAEELESALEQQPAVGRRLIVLSTSTWSQLVSVPKMGIDGLGDDDLAEALKFEVEPLSGIEADDAVIGFCETAQTDKRSGHRQFWINLAPRQHWDALRQIASARRIRDLSLLHPVGTTGREGQSHLEFWDNAVFLIDDHDQLAATGVLATGSDRWISDLGFESTDDMANRPVIAGPGTRTLPPAIREGNPVTDLADETQLGEWMIDAAENLVKGSKAEIPVIQQTPKKSAATGSWIIQIAALLLVTIFSAWHYSWLNYQQSLVNAKIAKLEQPGKAKQRYDAMLQEVVERRGESLKESLAAKSDLQKIRFLFEQQTDRVHTLLSKLVELRTKNLVIKEIEVTEKGTVVSGVSLDSEAAPQLTNRLREAVSSVGWKIHPATQEGQMKMINGGPWNFSILLEDVGPPTLINDPRDGAVSTPYSSRRMRP